MEIKEIQQRLVAGKLAINSVLDFVGDMYRETVASETNREKMLVAKLEITSLSMTINYLDAVLNNSKLWIPELSPKLSDSEIAEIEEQIDVAICELASNPEVGAALEREQLVIKSNSN